jgi:CHAT domain-containing protein/tetratricopeptide (TPR) repeat protein
MWRVWLLVAGLNGLAVAQAAAEGPSADALDEQATHLERAGRFAEALPLLQRALQMREQTLGPGHPGTVGTLHRLSLLHRAQGQYAQAVPLEQTRGTGHPDTAASLTNLAWLHGAQGRLAEATALQLRALAISETSLGPDHPETASALNNLAEIYRVQGRYAEALPLSRRALAIRENTLGPEHQDTATSAGSLAELLRTTGDAAQAEPLYQRALAIREKTLGQDHPDTARSVNDLAALHWAQGRYAQALPLFQRALAIREKTLGPDHPATATSLNNVAAVYLAQGQYAQALQYQQRAMDAYEKLLGREHPNTATSALNLALLYRARGEYARAMPLLQRALAIREKALGPEHADTAASLNGLALLHWSQGQYSLALPLQQRALAILEKALGPEHPLTAGSLSNLALLHRALGQYETAIPLQQRSVALMEKAYRNEHPEMATALNNLAGLHRLLGRFEQALPLNERALAIYESTSGPGHPHTATCLNSLGELYRLLDQPDRALASHQRALAIFERALGPDHPSVAETLEHIGRLYRPPGREPAAGSGRAVLRIEEALALVRRATAIRRARAAEAGRETAERAASARGGMFSARSGVTVHLQLLSVAPAVTGSSPEGSAGEAFEVAQLARASDTASAVTQMAARFASGDDELAALVRGWQEDVARLRYLDGELLKALSRAARQRDPEATDRLRAEIVEAERRLAGVHSVLDRRFPGYQVLIGNAPLGAADAQALLRPKEAMLSYLVGEHETYLWVVRRDHLHFFRLASGGKELERTVRQLRRALDVTQTQGRLVEYPAALAHELHDKVFAPAVPMLAGIERLIVVPDGALQSLPFAVLVSAPPPVGARLADVSWLAKRYAFSTLPSEASLKTLRRLAGSRSAPDPFVGFGDPAFKGEPGGRTLAALYSARGLADVEQLSQLAPLPDSGREIADMAASLGAGPESIFLGAAATESQVKRLDLGRYRTLAFATHGFTAGELRGAVEPALALTPPKTATEEDDGLLTASEIARLKLNADWVILSACNTAAPDGSLATEGLSGLARAFIFAGSRSLLVSHWPVDSSATARLTTTMLREIRKRADLPKDEALRRAMLHQLRSRRYSHPIYWAPFVIVGA